MTPPIGYNEDALVDINPEALDFRVASGLFAGLNVRNDSPVETISLVARHQGWLAPIFEETGFVTATFFPNPEVRAQVRTMERPKTARVGIKQGPSQAHDGAHEAEDSAASTPQVPRKYPPSTPQVGTKLGLSRDQVKFLDKCLRDSPIGELMALAGRTNRTKFRDQVLNPLLKAGFIEMTIPEKPNSSKQRYRTTVAGRSVLVNSDKESQS